MHILRHAVAVTTAYSLFLCAVAQPKDTPQGVPFGMKYEGGSLPLNQHDKLVATLGNNAVMLTQSQQHFDIPYSSITEISYGSDVHRRVGAAIGLGVLTLGLGAMLLLAKTKKHYVGMTWLDNSADEAHRKGGIVFKVGKGDYRGFLAALEGKAGMKAVNSDASLGTGGTSKP